MQWGIFSEKALDFIENSNSRLNISHGSVRSSKTINCSVRWLTYMIAGPPGDLCMLGKTTATLQRNVLNDLFDIVGPKNFKWINRQQGELKMLGRRIYCFGANNEDAESKIRGATFAGSYCDEVSLYPQSVFNQLMARMSVPGAMCFCNTNPDNPYHWFYTDYIKNDKIEDKKIWHFNMDDNPNLDPAYVKALKQMYTGVWYDRMILGEWVAAEGRVYDMFSADRHMVDTRLILRPDLTDPHAKPPAGIKWLVGCDYGTASVMSWGLYAKLPSGLTLKVREYYYDAVEKQKQKTDGEFAREFQIWLEGITPWAVYCDPSAASWKLELMQRGYRVLNADNDVVNGIRHVGSMLSQEKYLIDRSCVNTEQEYMSYVWDKDATVLGKDKPLKLHDHTCDTDRYVLYTESLVGRSGVY